MQKNCYLINQYKEIQDEIINTLDDHYQVIVIRSTELTKNKFKGKIVLIIEEILFLIKLITITHKLYNKNIICGSHHYSLLLYNKFLNLLKSNNKIFLFNLYIHKSSKYYFIKKILKFLLNQKIGMMVQSKNEIDYFKSISKNIDISYFPLCINDVNFNKNLCSITSDYIFSGGYTNRDYDLLIESSKNFPDINFIIICSNLNKLPDSHPKNVTILKDLPSDTFHSYLYNSKIVIIPLKEDVGSSGQMVALAAMQAGKPIIYPNFDVISQYFNNMINGVEYEAGEILSLNKSIKFCTENNDIACNIGENAKNKYFENFKRNNFLGALRNNINRYFEIDE